MIGPDLCDFSDAYIVVKVEVTLTGESNNSRKIGLQHLKAMLDLLIAYQKSIMY